MCHARAQEELESHLDRTVTRDPQTTLLLTGGPCLQPTTGWFRKGGKCSGKADLPRLDDAEIESILNTVKVFCPVKLATMRRRSFFSPAPPAVFQVRQGHAHYPGGPSWNNVARTAVFCEMGFLGWAKTRGSL